MSGWEEEKTLCRFRIDFAKYLFAISTALQKIFLVTGLASLVNSKVAALEFY